MSGEGSSGSHGTKPPWIKELRFSAPGGIEMTFDGVRPAFVERAERILDGIIDGELLTLKGHLLLEETLFAAVRAKCANPEYLEKANLSFNQTLQVARALYPTPAADEKRQTTMKMFWDAAKALNELRNQLAHHLRPKALGPILKRLYVSEWHPGLSLSDPAVRYQLGLTVAILIGWAWGLVDTAKEPTESRS